MADIIEKYPCQAPRAHHLYQEEVSAHLSESRDNCFQIQVQATINPLGEDGSVPCSVQQ